MMPEWQADRRMLLGLATEDLDLDESESRFLDWLAGWEPSTIAAATSIIWKARRLDVEASS